MEGIGSMEALGSAREKSLLASRPLLRKTGGHDIWAQDSLLYLYTNDTYINNSTEYLGKIVNEVRFSRKLPNFLNISN